MKILILLLTSIVLLSFNLTSHNPHIKLKSPNYFYGGKLSIVEVKKGLEIEVDNPLYKVVSFDFTHLQYQGDIVEMHCEGGAVKNSYLQNSTVIVGDKLFFENVIVENKGEKKKVLGMTVIVTE